MNLGLDREMAIRITFIFICIFLLNTIGFSQILQKIISDSSDQKAVSCVQDLYNNIYVLSESETAGNSKDMLINKLDGNASLLWSKKYGTSSDDIPTDIKILSNGTIVISGYTSLSGNIDILAVCIDSLGNQIWSNLYGGLADDYAFRMHPDNDSTVVLAGKTTSYGITTSSGYVLKINASGNIVWSFTSSIGGAFTPSNGFTAIDKTFDGGYILTGPSVSSNTLINMIKISASGVVLNHSYYLGSTGFSPTDIKSIPGGDFLITGVNRSSTSDTGSLFVLRYNFTAPNAGFFKIFSTINYEEGVTALVTPDGALAVIGNVFDGEERGLFYKLSLTGINTASRTYQIPGMNCRINYAIITNNNNILMVGETSDSANFNKDIYIIKSDLNGYSGCNEGIYTMTASSPQLAFPTGSNNNFGGLIYPIAINTNNVTYADSILCFTTDILEVEPLDFEIIPNPATDQFVIKTPITQGVVSLIDLSGKVILQIEQSLNSEVSIKGLSKGFYIVKIFDREKNQMSIQKLLKQ